MLFGRVFCQAALAVLSVMTVVWLLLDILSPVN